MALRADDHLESTGDLAAICAAALEQVTSVPGAMGAIYLERGGRLRCQAARGYLEVLDGLGADVGLAGHCLRTGDLVVVSDVPASAEHTPLRADVVAAACAPVRSGRRLVGVLLCESTVALTDGQIEQVSTVARALGAELAAVGGVPGETPAQRLTRHAALLAGLTKTDEIERTVLAAAVDISRMGSAMLLRVDGEGAVGARQATGPLALELQALPNRVLRTLAQSVKHGGSRYTVAPAERGRSVVQLPGTKVRTLLALPVLGDGSALEVLLLADRRAKPISTDEVEQLEMLCAHAASSLRVASLVRELRAQAATDPLTGLGHTRTFHTKLRRLRGRPLAVLAIDLDGFKQVNDTLGHQAGDRLLREMAATLASTLRRGDELFRVGGDEFTALVRVSSEAEAMDAAERLVAAAAKVGDVTVSVGVAMLDSEESTESVLGRADRALYEVKASGRNRAVLA